MKKAKKAPKKKSPRKKAVEMPAEPEITVATKELVRVVGDWQNPIWKKGVTESGDACKVRVPKRDTNRLRNKVVECERVDESNGTYYLSLIHI